MQRVSSGQRSAYLTALTQEIDRKVQKVWLFCLFLMIEPLILIWMAVRFVILVFLVVAGVELPISAVRTVAAVVR